MKLGLASPGGSHLVGRLEKAPVHRMSASLPACHHLWHLGDLASRRSHSCRSRSLHQDGIARRLMQTMDPNLSTREVEETAPATKIDNDDNDDHNDIEAEEENNHIENLSQMNANMHNCLLSVFKQKNHKPRKPSEAQCEKAESPTAPLNRSSRSPVTRSAKLVPPCRSTASLRSPVTRSAKLVPPRRSTSSSRSPPRTAPLNRLVAKPSDQIGEARPTAPHLLFAKPTANRAAQPPRREAHREAHLLHLQTANIAAAPTNETDRLALLKFKDLIGNDPHKILSSWNDSIHFCNWQGVTCSRQHQRVTALDLKGYTLRGSISPYVGNLSFLRVMDFIENKLIGNIPVELGSLRKLEKLYIGENNLTGGIPPSLGNISSLQALNLALNNIVGNIPDEIGHLQRLSFFQVAANNLSGMIPYSLYNISTMSIFAILINQLNGTLPDNIGLTLPNLRHLSVSTNNFFGSIPVSLSNASRLEIIDLSFNKFVGQVPTDLGNLLDLQSLSVGPNNLGSNNSMDLDFLTSLKNCTKLEYLDFPENNFGALENFINLTALNMANNLFTGSIPAYLMKFQKLEGLNLGGNRLSGHIPSSIGNLTQLVKLYLSQNNLEGSIPSSLGNCKYLRHLDISTNNLSGVIPISRFPQILALISAQNSLNGTLSVEVGNLKNIFYLDVSENNLSGEIPRTISDCLTLENLYLHGNSFQGTLPPSWASLRGLQDLDLSRNNLLGSIPKDLQNLSLLYLNLSFNNLEGEVPTEGVFRNASIISVTGNKKLCGGIPELQLQACDIKVKKRGKSHALKLTVIIVCGILCFLLSSLFLVLYWRRKSKKKSSSTLSNTELISKVSYKKLYQVTGGFSPNNLIGSGGFGSVYKGNGIIDQEEMIIAVKVLNLQQKGASKSFIAECNVLRNIRHRNLVKTLTCCASIDYKGNEFKAIVFEFMANGSLENWLHPNIDNENQSRNLNLLQRLIIAIDVASALHYLHENCKRPIIHCDLKPSNVLLDNDMIAHNTEWVVRCQSKGDVYSYGILVLEMFTGRRPTDKMFKDGFNLHNFVRMALPERLVQIVDPNLSTREVEETAPATEIDNDDNDDHNNIEAEEENNHIENLSRMNANMHNCLLSVFKVGLACSMESPRERINMEDVTRELYKIKNAFLGIGIHGR
uniref:Protein kinase domain-containing protein n=1 Tax=Fagus sylvatica TaxID=28930 RepID=A0A2N9G7Z1_FAGSY